MKAVRLRRHVPARQCPRHPHEDVRGVANGDGVQAGLKQQAAFRRKKRLDHRRRFTGGAEVELKDAESLIRRKTLPAANTSTANHDLAN